MQIDFADEGPATSPPQVTTLLYYMDTVVSSLSFVLSAKRILVEDRKEGSRRISNFGSATIVDSYIVRELLNATKNNGGTTSSGFLRARRGRSSLPGTCGSSRLWTRMSLSATTRA